LSEGETGYCGTRLYNDGTVWTTTYGLASHMEIEPIEKKAIYHFAPGTRLLSLGSYGCTWRCSHCHNWKFACVEQVSGSDRVLEPASVVGRAETQGCQGIGWGFNEPVLSAEFITDTMVLANERGLFGVIATNGALTASARRILAPVIDAWRIDIKGLSDVFYQALQAPGKWRGVLEAAADLKKGYNRHLEIVTCVIPGLNEDQVPSIARWIAEELGIDTPYHLTRFYPDRFMTDRPPTSVAVLKRAEAQARAAGLRYVYASVGAMGGHDTDCVVCGACLVRRPRGAETVVLSPDGTCPTCGERALTTLGRRILATEATKRSVDE